MTSLYYTEPYSGRMMVTQCHLFTGTVFLSEGDGRGNGIWVDANDLDRARAIWDACAGEDHQFVSARREIRDRVMDGNHFRADRIASYFWLADWDEYAG